MWNSRAEKKMKRTQALGATLIGVSLVYLYKNAGPGMFDSESSIAKNGPWSTTYGYMGQQQASLAKYKIVIVADLDKKSKMEGKKPSFKSLLKEGLLERKGDTWGVTWTEEFELKSQHNEAGRGLELSELVIFNDKLYTFDDRTGIVFEIDAKRRVIPREMFIEGDGESDKGQKTEWATVKDGVVYAGSFGKEYVGKMGEVTSRNNLWVSMMDKAGSVLHADWTDKYNVIRATTGSVHPAYQIIETIVWSAVNKRWFVLPRRVSQEAYDEDQDEKRGSNIVIVCNAPSHTHTHTHTLQTHQQSCNEAITSCEKFEVGTVTPERGFSSAKFIPGTGDTLMVCSLLCGFFRSVPSDVFAFVFVCVSKAPLLSPSPPSSPSPPPGGP